MQKKKKNLEGNGAHHCSHPAPLLATKSSRPLPTRNSWHNDLPCTHIYITARYPGHVISCLSCSGDLLTRLSALVVFPQSHTPHSNWSGLSQVTFQTLIVPGVRAFILVAPKTPMSFPVPSLASLPSPALYIPTLFSLLSLHPEHLLPTSAACFPALPASPTSFILMCPPLVPTPQVCVSNAPTPPPPCFLSTLSLS